MAGEKPQNYAEVLQALYDFLESEENESNISLEQTKAYLKREGLSSEPIVRNVQAKIAAIQGWKRLAAAQEQRKALLQELKTLCFRLRQPQIEAQSLKQAILGRVQELFGTGQATLAFYRKFEESSEADLMTLLEDAELTRLLEERDAGSGSESNS